MYFCENSQEYFFVRNQFFIIKNEKNNEKYIYFLSIIEKCDFLSQTDFLIWTTYVAFIYSSSPIIIQKKIFGGVRSNFFSLQEQCEHVCKLLKKSLENFSFFLVKRYFFMTAIFKYEVKTQKQTIFRQSLFGNYHSTLNYLSNDIQYVKLFTF